MSEEWLAAHRRRTRAIMRETGVPGTYALAARLHSQAQHAALRHRRALSIVLMTCAVQIEAHADDEVRARDK